jgi:precorrin-8X/cobalt-precorrin-8 methylmutase
MDSQNLTIKELIQATGGDITSHMVHHYHQIGLLSVPEQSTNNYRLLYTATDVQHPQRMVRLKSLIEKPNCHCYLKGQC